jgi:hypothetical protein
MEVRFKYRFDRRSRQITAAAIVVAAMLSAWTFWAIDGSYYSAWIASNAAAVAGLYALSIPRYVAVTETAVEIHCVVDLTRIAFDELRSARRMERDEMRCCIPLLGSYGFFGYYGYYLNLRTFDAFRIYASEWDNFVEIEDIYEQRCVVSCPEAERLTETILQRRQEAIRPRR